MIYFLNQIIQLCVYINGWWRRQWHTCIRQRERGEKRSLGMLFFFFSSPPFFSWALFQDLQLACIFGIAENCSLMFILSLLNREILLLLFLLLRRCLRFLIASVRFFPSFDMPKNSVASAVFLFFGSFF